MKNCLLALTTLLVLTSCAGVNVKRTEVASGATAPKAIYIRPFSIDNAVVKGAHGSPGERPLRRSLMPAEFAQALRDEMEKIAPTAILADDEVAPTGWLVEGEFDLVHSGSAPLRAALPHTGAGRSTIRIHVRISDVSRHAVVVDSKDVSAVSTTAQGQVLYEFDVAGGSALHDPAGTIYASGLGYSTPFDFRNAAERIMMALTPDPHRYGVRSSPVIR